MCILYSGKYNNSFLARAIKEHENSLWKNDCFKPLSLLGNNNSQKE